MSLSDTCFEALIQLNTDFHRYLDWGYQTENMSKLASIILALTELAQTLQLEPRILAVYKETYGAPKSVRLIAECAAIGDLIADPVTHRVYEAGVETVASIASINPTIRDAIINAYNWQQSPAGIVERFRHADVINVEPVYRRIADL